MPARGIINISRENGYLIVIAVLAIDLEIKFVKTQYKSKVNMVVLFKKCI